MTAIDDLKKMLVCGDLAPHEAQELHDYVEGIETLPYGLWRGECGHHWIKRESDNCPQCKLDRIAEIARRAISGDEAARGDPDGNYAQGQIDLGRAIQDVLK